VIVCHCRVVTDRQVTQAVERGARSLSGVCRSTGAGQDCGSCVFSVRRLLCEHEDARAAGLASQPVPALSEVDVAAS
jgi:bacterioferritin-associated ferredoxin